jgi:hypothetical protein
MKNIVVGTLVALLLMALFGFYWFEYRAMSARIACAKMTQDIRYIVEKEAKGKIDVQSLNTRMQNEYAFCLHSKGL